MKRFILIPLLLLALSSAVSFGAAELILKNGRVLDVFSGRFRETDVAIAGGRIVGFGSTDATYASGLEKSRCHISPRRS